jgi:uncharacterized protein (DUF4415 family)
MRKSERSLGSGLARLDATTDEEIARQIAEDPDAAPKLTEEWFKHAEVWEGDRYIGPARGGRPKGSGTKEMVTLRLDKDVLARFRAGGPGWQTRLNDALRAVAPSEQKAAGQASQVALANANLSSRYVNTGLRSSDVVGAQGVIKRGAKRLVDRFQSEMQPAHVERKEKARRKGQG